MSRQNEKHNASIVIIIKELQNISRSFALLKTLVVALINDGTEILATCARKVVEI
jgi:hypothetical protein